MIDEKAKKQLEDAPMYNPVNINDCTHVGYIVGYGFEAFAITERIYHLISAQVCIRCGKNFQSLSVLEAPSPKPASPILSKGGTN